MVFIEIEVFFDDGVVYRPAVTHFPTDEDGMGFAIEDYPAVSWFSGMAPPMLLMSQATWSARMNPVIIPFTIGCDQLHMHQMDFMTINLSVREPSLCVATQNTITVRIEGSMDAQIVEMDPEGGYGTD